MKPTRPAGEVIRDRSDELMKLREVAGVYEGALPDGRPCIVVMIASEDSTAREDIPAVLEGYPVRLEFGGPVRPMR